MPRQVIEIANPRRLGETHTSMSRAVEYVKRGIAYIKSGKLVFKAHSDRVSGDVYVDQRGMVWWNGARSKVVDGRDIATYPPCCNVVFPKVGLIRS